MDLKTFFLRLAVLVIAVAAGGFAYAITFHLLQGLGLMPDQLGEQGFGRGLTYRTSFVYMATIVVGIISLFIRDRWRYVLLLSPIYAPPLFAIIFTLMHQT